MKIPLFLSLYFWFSAFAIQPKNVPYFEPEKPNVVHFCTQKNFSDGSLREELLQVLKIYFNVDLFIETGTHFGDTTSVAAKVFERVHTIEIFPPFYQRSQERLKNFPNVSMYQGDSSVMLAKLLSVCNERALFYLDGHFDGGVSGRGNKNTPILEELEAIRSWGRVDSVILIDDLVDFYPTRYPAKIKNTFFDDYPSLNQVLNALLSINPEYKFCFIANSLLAYPPSEEVTVSPVLSACAIDILSTITDQFSEEELQRAEETIGSAIGSERDALKYYYQMYSDFERKHGWYSFSTFWMGLLSLNERRIREANILFKSCAESSIEGWRVDSYYR